MIDYWTTFGDGTTTRVRSLQHLLKLSGSQSFSEELSQGYVYALVGRSIELEDLLPLKNCAVILKHMETKTGSYDICIALPPWLWNTTRKYPISSWWLEDYKIDETMFVIRRGATVSEFCSECSAILKRAEGSCSPLTDCTKNFLGKSVMRLPPKALWLLAKKCVYYKLFKAPRIARLKNPANRDPVTGAFPKSDYTSDLPIIARRGWSTRYKRKYLCAACAFASSRGKCVVDYMGRYARVCNGPHSVVELPEPTMEERQMLSVSGTRIDMARFKDFLRSKFKILDKLNAYHHEVPHWSRSQDPNLRLTCRLYQKNATAPCFRVIQNRPTRLGYSWWDFDIENALSLLELKSLPVCTQPCTDLEKLVIVGLKHGQFESEPYSNNRGGWGGRSRYYLNSVSLDTAGVTSYFTYGSRHGKYDVCYHGVQELVSAWPSLLEDSGDGERNQLLEKWIQQRKIADVKKYTEAFKQSAASGVLPPVCE